MKLRPKVFVGSPYRYDVERNEAFAEDCCKLVADNGGAPFAPHLIFTRFLDDTIEDDRETGIECGKAWLLSADCALFFTDNGLTHGMLLEIAFCRECSIPHAVCKTSERDWSELLRRVYGDTEEDDQ